MYELIEQVLGYLRGIWRYRWYVVISAWLVALIGWAVVIKLPDQYEANARVHVDTDSILRPLLKGLAIQSNVSHRVRLMTRTLLSRPNLEKVVRMVDLDIKVKTPEAMEELLDDLEKEIELSSNRQEPNLYTISYQNQDPQLAKKIVQSLLTIFVETALGETRQDSDTAQKFIEEQIREYELRLEAAEERIKEFKRKNVDVMLSSGEDYFGKLQAAQAELGKAKLLLQEASNRRDELQRQLGGEEPVFGFGGNVVAAHHPLDGKIKELRTRMDELLLKYTENHPDVTAIQDKIDAMEAQKKKDVEASPQTYQRSPELEQNPVYQQLKVSLGEAEASVASLQVRVDEYKGRVRKLEQLVDTIPEVEAQIKRLDRDYAIDKKNYDELVARREAASLSESAGRTGDDVRFRVIDPPRVPLEPAGPNRTLFLSLVLAVGFGMGIALAFVISQIKATFDSRVALREVTGLPVLGSISMEWTPAQRMKIRIEVIVFAIAGFMLLLAYGLVLLFQQQGVELLARLG